MKLQRNLDLSGRGECLWVGGDSGANVACNNGMAAFGRCSRVGLKSLLIIATSKNSLHLKKAQLVLAKVEIVTISLIKCNAVNRQVLSTRPRVAGSTQSKSAINYSL